MNNKSLCLYDPFNLINNNHQIPQDSINSINIHEIQNFFLDSSFIPQDKSFLEDDDFNISFLNELEYINEKEGGKECNIKKDKEYKKVEECFINNNDKEYLVEKSFEYIDRKEDNSENNESKICDENYFLHANEGDPEKKAVLFNNISYLNKEYHSFEQSGFIENFYEECSKLSKEENMHQDANQIINLIETKTIYLQKFPEEKVKENNYESFSSEDKEIKRKNNIPKNVINSNSSLKHSINCPCQNDSGITITPSGWGKPTTPRMFHSLEDISSPILKIGDSVVNDVESKDHDIAKVFQNYALFPHNSQHKTDNLSQMNINPNISGIHNNSENKINISNELNDSKQKQIQKNSTLKGSTGDSTQKNNPNISLINKYKYPFEIIHPKEEDFISKNMKLNMSSENLYSNFKRKRKIITEEVKKHRPFKKSEDLEKSILRKFKRYLRYKKDNKFKYIFDKDRNFWDSFFKNSKPFEFEEEGETKKFNSYGKDLMNFIFKRDNVDDLYKEFVSDKIYIKDILENLGDKSEGYKRAYLITLKSLNKKYNGKYKDEDLELGLNEFS